jgi:flagellar FliL protein
MSKTEVQAEGAGGAKKKGRLLIIIVAVVVLIAGGAGAWLMLGGGGKSEHVEAKVATMRPPTFFTLDPFVVNLAGEAQHYLQVGIDLKIADEHVKDQIKAHLPEIRNGVLLLLSSKQIDELSSLDGKNRLRAEIRDAVNQPLGIHTAAAAPPASTAGGSGEAHAAPSTPAATGERPVEGVLEVLLTSFVIQ